MGASRAFAAFVCDRLAPLGAVTARAMFGGFGLYCDGRIFALIADDILYLKACAENRPVFEARGLAPFRPFADRPAIRPMVMPYYPVPADVLAERETLCAWAATALAGAAREPPPRTRRRNAARRGTV